MLRESGIIKQEVDGTRHRNWLRREELDRRFPGLLALVLDANAEASSNPSEPAANTDQQI